MEEEKEVRTLNTIQKKSHLLDLAQPFSNPKIDPDVSDTSEENKSETNTDNKPKVQVDNSLDVGKQNQKKLYLCPLLILIFTIIKITSNTLRKEIDLDDPLFIIYELKLNNEEMCLFTTLKKPSETFRTFRNLQKPSETFKNLQNPSETFRNLQPPSTTFNNL